MNKPIPKKEKKKYFTKEHEDAILEYVATDDIVVRTELYIKFIGPVFDQMVDKIVFTYKFANLPNIEILKDDCKVWLVTILDKFDASKGSKAFSYFSVITKNYFIHEVKKTSRRAKKEVDYEKVCNIFEDILLSNNDHPEKLVQRKQFWQKLSKEMEFWLAASDKEIERNVLKAIQIVFNSINDIEIFNKKACYLYLREISGYSTKQIANSLNKIRQKYKEFKDDWNNGDI